MGLHSEDVYYLLQQEVQRKTFQRRRAHWLQPPESSSPLWSRWAGRGLPSPITVSKHHFQTQNCPVEECDCFISAFWEGGDFFPGVPRRLALMSHGQIRAMWPLLNQSLTREIRWSLWVQTNQGLHSESRGRWTSKRNWGHCSKKEGGGFWLKNQHWRAVFQVSHSQNKQRIVAF